MNIDALLTVRTGSKRLTNKCFLKFGKYNVLEHCIARCLDENIKPIICTTNLKNDNIFSQYAKKNNIRLFRGSEKNKIKRWNDCCKLLKLKKFHTIDVDDPFFDPKAIRSSLKQLKFADLVLPSYISRNGSASEGYSFTNIGIEKLYLSLFKYKFKSIDNFDTEMIDEFIKDKQIKKISFEGMKYQIKQKTRLTLDYKEDYIFLSKIINNFEYSTSREKINNFIRKNYEIQKINLFLNDKWKKKQNKFNLKLNKL